jgi:hypothetical protein
VTGVCLIRSEPSGAQWSRGPAVMAAGVLIQLAVLFRAKPGMYLEEFAHLELFKLGVVLEAALVGAGVMGGRRLARSWFPAILVLNLALGVWMLNASPDPHIDVLEVHDAALRALGRGRNPYQITFRNIYGPNSGLYNPEAVSGEQVLFGYPYPPMSLLVVAPGRLIFRDYRYAELAALVAGAAFIGYAGASVTARLAAVLLLTTPRGFFVLEQGWTEPVAVLMLGATLWSLMKCPAWSPWIGGLFVVTKQYLGLAGPLLWKTGAQRPQNAWGFLWRAGVAASLVTVPFALWNLRAFIDTVILLQIKEPFRIDSLSFVSWAARAGLGEGSFVWAAGAAVVALAFVLWRTPSTAAGFAGGLALTTLVTFSMGSKAFCNYYFFVVAALCAALAALDTSARVSGELDNLQPRDHYSAQLRRSGPGASISGGEEPAARAGSSADCGDRQLHPVFWSRVRPVRITGRNNPSM